MRKKTVLLTENQLKSVIKRILLEISFFQHDVEKQKGLSGERTPEDYEKGWPKERLQNKKKEVYELSLEAKEIGNEQKYKKLENELVAIENELEDRFDVERDLTERPPEGYVKYWSLGSEHPAFMFPIIKAKAKQQLSAPPMRKYLNPGENP